MKATIKLLFAAVIIAVLGSCQKENAFQTNVQSYDLRDPGLSNQQVGEVKWIFCLKYGETKYLDIDGEMYKTTLSALHRRWLDPDTYMFYADLEINSDKISVSTPRYISEGYTDEENLKVYILRIKNSISECFFSDNAIDSFIKEFGEGSLINNSFKIYLSGYQDAVSAVDADPIEEFRVIFTIIKKEQK